MKLIKRIYEELNIYYDNYLLKMVRKMLIPWYVIAGITTICVLLNFLFDVHLNKDSLIMLVFISILIPIVTLIGLLMIWKVEVKPIIEQTKHSILLKEKWKLLYDKFNKTH